MTAAATQASNVKPDRTGGRRARDASDDAVRRCIVTGEILPREALIRFVIGPDHRVWPDLDEKLPGRGLWVACDAAALDTAIRKNLFAKAARQQAVCPPDLAAQTAALLHAKLLQLVGLARRSGICITGFAQVEPAVRNGSIALLLLASDAGADGAGKLLARLEVAKIKQILTSRELGDALGHNGLVYAGLRAHQLTDRIAVACKRFSALRPQEKIAPEPGLAQIGGVLGAALAFSSLGGNGDEGA